jgi:predicted permease
MSLAHRFPHGWREFRSQPAMSAVAVLTLALGVAGATTMFATLRALGGSMVPPGVDAARVGRIVWTAPQGAGRQPLTTEEFGQLARAATAFDTLSASADETLALDVEGRTVAAKQVTPDFFRTFGCRPRSGRLLGAADSRNGGRVALVSESLVRRQPGLRVGGPLTLAGSTYEVVGLMPESCWFPSPGGPDVWLPMPDAAGRLPGGRSLTVTFRLSSGAVFEGAQSQLAQIGRRLAALDPSAPSRRLRAIPLAEDAGKRLGMGMVGLLAPALAVLLIACANVANLLLARAARRQREMAIRASLGATRLRLARDCLAEGAWLAVAGGLAGTGLAGVGVRLVRTWIGSFESAAGVAAQIRLDGAGVLFALGVTAAIPIVFGLVPAVAASKPDLVAALHRSSGPAPPRRGPYGTRDLLVVVEIALAVVLVVTTGMFARFFDELNRVEWGFDPARVLAAPLGFVPGADFLQAVGGAPGVRAAAVGQVPGLPRIGAGDAIDFEGCLDPGRQEAVVSAVGAGYFEALGVSVLRGRGIEARDAGGPPVGVIGAAHAARCWPGADPLGRRFRLRGDSPWITVVGVVPDVMKTRAFPHAPRHVYLARESRDAGAVLVIRFDGPSAPVAQGVRAAMLRTVPNQTLEPLVPLDEEFKRRLGGPPLLIGLLGGFGAFALLLGALGVFSVMSYTVAERTREFGIRVALGSSRIRVLRLVLRHALAVVFIGTGISAAGSLAVARATFPEMASLAAADPLLWVSVAGLLATAALAASALPAWRAVSVEPTEALRSE